jgi:uncharacterized membrane protein
MKARALLAKRPLPPAEENIAAVANLERQFLEERTLSERIGDAIGAFVGTMIFVVLHLLWFTSWFLINLGLIPGIHSFDPFPFILLSVCVSVEAVFLTTFVLMKQNRMSRRADQRNHLALQVDILAERETTKALQMLRAICAHLGLEMEAAEPEAKQLSQETAVETLARELKRKIPE